jgi:DNA-binding NtrC family response regulator
MAILSNRLILVVEDEMLIMMEIEDALADAGCTLLIASRVSEAMALAETEAIDCAFLDVSVAGEAIFPVASILTRRNIPFVLSTGYGSAGLPTEYRDRPMLPKPYLADQIPRAIAAALS